MKPSTVAYLYTIDIVSGLHSQVAVWTLPAAQSGDDATNGLSINSIGYNPTDSYLYGTLRGRFPEVLNRLGYDGSVNPILSLNNTVTSPGRYYIGDFDSNGQYYTAAQANPTSGNLAWIQVNLNQALPNYG